MTRETLVRGVSVYNDDDEKEAATLITGMAAHGLSFTQRTP